MVREDIYSAFFSILQSAQGFQTISRKLAHIDDVPKESMPYAAQNQIRETPFADTLSGPSATQIELSWFIYVAESSDSSVPSAPILNAAVDSVMNLLPSVANPVTLQVNNQTYIVIRGPVQYFEGLLGDKAAAKIDFIVRVPFA